MKSDLTYKIRQCQNEAELEDLVNNYKQLAELEPPIVPPLTPEERQQITLKRAEFARARK